ncbi:MAG: translation initiation factor IF-2 [Deltaproteobacteria bacterium]|nr:translation initiation factor IF-2 [Deltaproteobacteria bacterium]
MAKVRIYQLAKELGLPNKDLITKLRGLGVDVRNHMSVIDSDESQRVRRALEKERAESREVSRLSSTVIRRRSRVSKDAPAVPVAETPRSPAVAAPRVERAARRDAPQGEVVYAAPSLAPEEPFAAEAAADASPPPPAIEADTRGTPEVVEPIMPAAEYIEATPEPVIEVPPPVEIEHPAFDEVVEAVAVEDDQQEISEEDSPEAGVLQEMPGGRSRPQVRYAPGFEPGGKYAQRPPGRYGRTGGQGQQRQAVASASGAPGAEPPQLSAAEAARMMSPAKPRVVITDLDARRGARREVTRADLLRSRTYRQQQQQRGRKKKTAPVKRGKKTEITTPAEHKRVIRVESAIGVGELAHQMGVKASEVLKKLWAMGLTNIMINESIDVDTASLLASEFGYEVDDVAFREESVLSETPDSPEDMQPRAAVITVMGHVDHGKTSLLDALRDTDVAAGEAGGITQHMAAYRVKTRQGEIVCLDTPGHEAFTHMRARGAQCTDVVVLVVAADDGVMPQTVEAIDHARDAEVPIIVAINKMDLPDANPDRVKSELAERGLVPEDWGGDVMFIPVSARTGEGVPELTEALALQAEIMELTANPTKPARGTIIEAKLDRARGAMCTVLVQEGTLRVGDHIVAGHFIGKIRAMLDDRGNSVKDAPPSTPVEILGLGGVPAAGDQLNVVADEKLARQVAEHRQQAVRRRELAGASASKTYEEILGQIQSGDAHELKLLVKSDVHGTSEALRDSLLKLSTERVSVNVISAGVGGIHEADVNLAKASGAVIVGFNVRPAGKASQLAERERVEIRIYDVIYELLDDVKILMQGLLPKDRHERFAGRAEVRETFTIPRVGVVAGCAVLDGRISRGSHLRLIRDSVKIYDGRVATLRRFKEDVKEVEKGYECGLGVEGYNEIQVGDIIECYDVEEVAASLN